MTQNGQNPDEFSEEYSADSTGSAGEQPGADSSAPGPDSAQPESAPGAALDAVVAELEQTKEDLARSRADYYNLNQEYGNYVRRTKGEGAAQRQLGQEEVAESLLGLLDDIDAARDAGELEGGPFAAMAAKLEDTLSDKFGVERFGLAGEDFDPQLHEALMAQTNPEVDRPVIKQVLQPGYRVRERVLRPTKVLVDNPE